MFQNDQKRVEIGCCTCSSAGCVYFSHLDTHSDCFASGIGIFFPNSPPTLCSMYNNLVERCFDGCVTSFRSKTLDKSENTCLVRRTCSGKHDPLRTWIKSIHWCFLMLVSSSQTRMSSLLCIFCYCRNIVPDGTSK
jgi:Tim10/DDP family zinc finger